MVTQASAPIRVFEITEEAGSLLASKWLARALPVHRQLRELPKDLAGYEQRLKRIFANGGRLSLAVSGPDVLGLTLWRLIENTHDGLKLYVEDLVTDQARRSTGVGRALIAHLETLAREHGCDVYALDSGTQRHRAHHFYFREGFAITSYSFRKVLKG